MSSQHPPSANVLLYGAGSIGGVYLYQLLQAGCHVTTVCRSTYTLVKENGFKLSSARFGDVAYRPTSVVRDISECTDESFDFVLVCTKAFPGCSPSLADQLRPVLEGKPQTAVVLAQNGVMIEEEIAAAFPQNTILSGVVYCPAAQTSPGAIKCAEMVNLLELGTNPSNAPESQKADARRFADLMIRGGGDVEIHEDIQVARWSKLLLNAAWNPIGALTLTSDGDFLRSSDPYALNLAWGVMTEIVELAQKAGIEGVTIEVAQKKIETSKRRAKAGGGIEMSMLQDVRQGRKFEVEAIIGNAVRLGREKGVSMPRMETLYALANARCWALIKENSEKSR